MTVKDLPLLAADVCSHTQWVPTSATLVVVSFRNEIRFTVKSSNFFLGLICLADSKRKPNVLIFNTLS